MNVISPGGITEARRPSPVSVRLPPELAERLRARAPDGERSQWIVAAVAERLDREDRGELPAESLAVARLLTGVPPEVWRYLLPVAQAIMRVSAG